jgi:serine/threonine protein kinase/WD40 repeat protein
MQLSSDDRGPVELLADDFLSRCKRGEKPTIKEYCDRHPELADEIRDIFEAVLMVEDLKPGPDDASASLSESIGADGKRLKQVGDYRILCEIGRGGMGVVYEAEQQALGRRVALKVMPRTIAGGGSAQIRFQHEAKAAARMHHTNIVPVFDVGHDGEHLYYAMQLIHGQGLDLVISDLKRLRARIVAEPPTNGVAGDRSIAASLATGQFEKQNLAALGPNDADDTAAFEGSVPSSAMLPGQSDISTATSNRGAYFRCIAQIGLQTASALSYAHSRGIVHRDIKPGNLILDTTGNVWVTDFGLAKTGDDAMTHTGDILGTVRYMSPERFRGQCDVRADVYALGMTLYELLTLKAAYASGDRLKLIELIRQTEAASPRSIDARIPRDLETIVMKAIDKDPKRRYQSADEMAEDLQRFVNDEPIKARPVGQVERLWRWCRRNPRVAGLTAMVACLLVLIAVVASSAAAWLHQERNRTQEINEQLVQQYQKTDGERQRAEKAERARTEQLVQSSLREAEAGRWSGRVGRRFDSLKALTEAAQLARALDLPDDRLLQLRNEAIACLSLVDLRLANVRKLRWEPPWSRAPAFDPGLERYAVGDNDGVIRVVRVADGQELARLRGPNAGVHVLRFSPDGRFLAAVHHTYSPKQLWVWDLEDLPRGRPVLQLEPGAYHEGFDFSPDSRLIAVDCRNRETVIYDLPGGKVVRTLPPGLLPATPRALRFDPEGRRLAVSSMQAPYAEIRELDTGKSTKLPHAQQVRAVAWRRDGRLLATACDDRSVYVWDVATGQQVHVLRGHQAAAIHVFFNHAGDLLGSGGWDGRTILWDYAAGRQLVAFDGSTSEFGPNDRALPVWTGSVEAGFDVVLCEVAAGRECRTFRPQKYERRHASIGLEGRLLACPGERVQLYDLITNQEVASLPVPGSEALFDPSGHFLLTTSLEGMWRWPTKYETSGGERTLAIGPPELCVLPGQRLRRTVATTPDGQHLVVSGLGQAMVMRGDRLTEKIELRPHQGLEYVAISPDGAWAATGIGGGTGVKVWDARNGNLIHVLPITETSAAVAFSPDGEWLVTCTGHEYRFWQVGTWQPGLRLGRQGAGNMPGNILFSRDGKLLAIAHTRTVVKLVNPATGQELATLPPVGNPLCLSADGSLLVTAGEEAAVLVWDLRFIREQLKHMGLDWGSPPYPEPKPGAPFQVKVDLGDLAKQNRPVRAAPQQLIEKYTAALETNPNDAEAYHQRAHAYEKLAEYQKAVEDFTSALQRKADNAHFYEARGKNYVKLKEPAKAVEDFQRSLDLKPEQSEVCNDLAWLLVAGPESLRDAKRAVPLAERAVKRDQQKWAYQQTLGVVYYRAGRYRDAVSALETSLRTSGGQSDGFDLYFLAMCHHHLGDTVKAKECFDRAAQWSEQHRPRLSPERQQELQAFGTEAGAVLAGKLPQQEP